MWKCGFAVIIQSRGNNKGWSDKKMHEVCSSRSLEEVLVSQSEQQICLALLAINICEIKGNLTESKLGSVCVSLLKWTEIRGFFSEKSLAGIFKIAYVLWIRLKTNSY